MDKLTPGQRSAQMARIRGKDTKPELLVRKMAHRAGFRFRLHGQLSEQARRRALRLSPETRLPGGKLPGKPDLVFASQRKVVFVNGCFWHLHDCKVGRHAPASNTEFWDAKRQATAARDLRNKAALQGIGWDVLDIWECELKDPAAVLVKLNGFLGRAAAQSGGSAGDACPSRDARYTSGQ